MLKNIKEKLKILFSKKDKKKDKLEDILTQIKDRRSKLPKDHEDYKIYTTIEKKIIKHLKQT